MKNNIDLYGEIPDWPAFYVFPYFAVWAIESKRNPNYVGYWVFSGDIPADVVVRDWNDDSDNPRKAMKRLMERWRSYIPILKKGDSPPDVNLGSDRETRIEMAELLEGRIKAIAIWIEDNSIWEEDCII